MSKRDDRMSHMMLHSRPVGDVASGRASLGASHALALADRDRRADQCEMGERLGEVPELPAGHRVVFLGEEPDVVAEIQEPLEELARLVQLALKGEDLRQPERAGNEDALAGREAIDVAVAPGDVALDEPVDRQLPPNRVDRGREAWVVRIE